MFKKTNKKKNQKTPQKQQQNTHPKQHRARSISKLLHLHNVPNANLQNQGEKGKG